METMLREEEQESEIPSTVLERIVTFLLGSSSVASRSFKYLDIQERNL